MESCGEDSKLGFPFWVAVRRRFEPSSPFFEAGNFERELIAKQVALDLTEDERFQLQNMEGMESRSVFCPIVGCGAQLNSLEEFEDHYNSRHTASCSVCARVYPTSHLLSIHISEVHDSFFKAKVARGFPMYECLVEGCGMKLKSYKSRQQHLIDKHKFPASFDFSRRLTHLSISARGCRSISTGESAITRGGRMRWKSSTRWMNSSPRSPN
ncbi:hypothetical protein QJS10_CPB04g00209 [Acorus calamus]|uniref:C2H2-type domain-containing protein n=1 Tax=Acorus calamus TaxID=4465 RepID=A0AAV9EZ61_ACOCL|nr:hypothetical protein QJS10_CPB04g00209 [Acorus calamus]